MDALRGAQEADSGWLVHVGEARCWEVYGESYQCQVPIGFLLGLYVELPCQLYGPFFMCKVAFIYWRHAWIFASLRSQYQIESYHRY